MSCKHPLEIQRMDSQKWLLSFMVSLGRPGGNQSQQAGHANLGTNRFTDSEIANHSMEFSTRNSYGKPWLGSLENVFKKGNIVHPRSPKTVLLPKTNMAGWNITTCSIGKKSSNGRCSIAMICHVSFFGGG